MPCQATSCANDRTLEAYEKWTVEHDWDIFGTLTFIPNRKPHIDTAQKHWSRFWHKVDQLTFGQMAVRSGARVERAVCTHSGRLDDNPHIHFVAKSPIKDINSFCVCLNALWAATALESAPPDNNAICPALNVKQVGEYLYHEFWKMGSETFNGQLTYLNIDRIELAPRLDAANRLKVACKTTWLTKAQQALPNHIKNAQALYIKRHAH